MTKKVKLAIIDKDLKARIFKNFPLSKDGAKINVVESGKNYFTPAIDTDSYIELPSRSIFPPWRIKWNRIYFVNKGATKCINFKTETILDPDPSLVLKAAGTKMLMNLGKEKKELDFIFYIILLVCIGIALKVFGVIV
jgi:hypothetical protein